ncbi:MAG: methyltransferase [Bacteroidota bacterium]
MRFDEKYWSEQYKSQLTGWDAGNITTPLKEYIDQLEDKSIRILVPGCGNGHEVRYLYDKGFVDVVVIDISPKPIESLKIYCSEWRSEQFIVGDFFKHKGEYDLILEQTFFSSIVQSERVNYASKTNDLLKDNGKLVGLLFIIDFPGDYPPFGGTRGEYINYFEPLFELDVFEVCYNSIKPRKGNELFINLRKRKIRT